ncbi:small nuclear ribonucleoprotein E [Emericellopsis cladophorae]|uniref:Small nuclear ribonucleoprotein E n=1 Tax=Emericellopsis cladophorae TaxID=2686198 RepID=A0A9Q0BCP5_9HYPO|nr:small nuclear ribonucleoprotein E [Emericellopsis cladophorae]KAI6779765.1 small nuclear ribonucleoprotein E [Emericellopsis cladophorae]
MDGAGLTQHLYSAIQYVGSSRRWWPQGPFASHSVHLQTATEHGSWQVIPYGDGDSDSETQGKSRVRNTPVSVWLYEQLAIRIEGKIRGFDEFMNIVLDDAVEVKQITKTNPTESRRALGQILLKGDNVSLIQSLE